MTRVKICGLRRPEDVAAVNRFLPDYIGFVFAESRRRVTPDEARKLKNLLDPHIKAAGVFVNAPVQQVLEAVNTGIIDLIQLHGDEDEAYLKMIRQSTPYPIIKAVRVRSKSQILEAQKLPCDMLLLDAYKRGQYGGGGEGFDLSLIPPLEKPFFLAGGLSLTNIAQKIAQCRPYCADISSGAETDGVKDPEKIGRIIGLIRHQR